MTTIDDQVREVRRLKAAFEQAVEVAARIKIAHNDAEREAGSAQTELRRALDQLDQLVVGGFDRRPGFYSAIDEKVSVILGQSLAKTLSDRDAA